jgi:Cupin-like domain
MSAYSIPRIHLNDLPVERFLREFSAGNRPVIVTGAMDSWHIEDNWTPAALERVLGNESAQVYNNYFDLQQLMPLNKYFAEYFNRTEAVEDPRKLPYVRWYTKLRDVRFFWADAAFKKLAANWALPAFLPKSDYMLPYAPCEQTVDPTLDHFPAKGLFISPRGGRTSLHLDPWGSCAVLCQLYGRKRWFFYGPDQEKYLRNGAKLVDPTAPDLEMFPDFHKAAVTAECMLEPGETIYVPHGWCHEVHSETDAISLTWNFVHSSTASFLDVWLQGDLSDFEQSVLRFFYRIDKDQDVRAHVHGLVHQRLAAA